MSETIAAQQDVRNITRRIREVAALPQVVFQIIQLTDNMATSARDIERVVSVDPGLSTRILTLANSSYYALPRKVTSIREAVVFLGFRAIRQLAMTVGCFELFVGKSDRSSLWHRERWRHALSVANYSRSLGAVVRDCLPDEAYAAGLLHDIGKSLLCRYGGTDYLKVEDLIKTGVPTLEAEITIYGCDHAILGREVAAQWHFPKSLADAIGTHHEFISDVESPVLTATIATANAITHFVSEHQEENDDEVSPLVAIPEWAKPILNTNDDSLLAWVKTCRETLDAATSLSNVL
ncbi:MAG: HDOD domain-containing protein [bacterium]|jgi:putative nucleotidyltransferase with HDIG domain